MLGASGCATVNGGATPDPAPATTPAGQTPPVEPTVVSYPEYRDPLIWLNRGIFAFNDVFFRYLLIPASKAWMWAVPGPARTGVDNFFHNLKTPIYAVNHLLQLEPRPLGRSLARFGINTTIGLLGLFDPAKAWFGLERAETHFGDTLADYGAGYGIYLVLPLLGPSDLRNGTSRFADYFLNPAAYITEEPQTTAVNTFDSFQLFAPGAEGYATLRQKSDDPYLFFRNLYLQGVQRDAAAH